MGKTVDLVTDMAKPLVEAQGLELVDLEYVKEGGHWFLRVFIERPEGEVSLDDCEKVSTALSAKLDEADPIENSYILEVSSPGIERPLKKLSDYDRFLGQLAKIKTFAPINGEKEFLGKIIGREGDEIYIKKEDSDEALAINFYKIAAAHLTIDFG